MMNNGLLRAKLRKTRGVRTVLPADNQHQIHIRRKTKRGRLSLIGGRANSPYNPYIIGFRNQLSGNLLEARA